MSGSGQGLKFWGLVPRDVDPGLVPKPVFLRGLKIDLDSSKPGA